MSERKRSDRPVSFWRERESIGGKAVDAGVVILRTNGCRHFHGGGCSMCGYNVESRSGVTSGDVLRQFDDAVKDLGDIRMLKIYTSGSFLDECEVADDALGSMLAYCSEHRVRLLFESRPEFVTKDKMRQVISKHDDIEVALGLESANDLVLTHSINKGFLREDYDRAAATLNDSGAAVRTYVLLKPPFLTEAEAIADSISTIDHASKFSETVSLNPVNVQKGTLVEKMWRNWSYRPPWLWSVLEVLRSTAGRAKRLVCEPTGGGRERGAHNCGKCDDTILISLKAFSESQDPSRLAWPECSCREIWSGANEIEGYAMGGPCDLQRLSRRAKA